MSIEVVTTIEEMRARVAGARREGRSVGLVATMGALREGHGSLIDRARAECALVVVSIFVNPTQFNQPSDFRAYPRTLDADVRVCGARGADLVFAPSDQEMYPEAPLTSVEVAALTEHLCGRYRPGHFRGVATVVTKLFGIVCPDRAYFGEKDAQQLAVIRRMVADLNLPVTVVPVPTVREADGLAMSSRNARLAPEHRPLALALSRALREAARVIETGDTDVASVLQAGRRMIPERPDLRLEYLEVVDADTMQPVLHVSQPVRVAGALWVGDVRLIDNVAAGGRPASPPSR